MKKEFCTTTLKITPGTADNFRRYARQLGKQQSETLQIMMDFFEINGLSPYDKLVPNVTALEKGMKTRINAMVAILKDIEKTQTKPSHAMLQLLFQEKPAKRKEILVEKEVPIPERESYPLKNPSASPRSVDLERKLTETSRDLKEILEKVEVVHSRFGKNHLRLNMSTSEFEKLKSKLKSTQ